MAVGLSLGNDVGSGGSVGETGARGTGGLGGIGSTGGGCRGGRCYVTVSFVAFFLCHVTQELNR